MADSILIIEDDEKIFELIRTNIAELGLPVYWAADGSEGLLRAQQEEFSIIILDLMLPKLGGKEVCRRLREAGDTTPILMLTARGDELDRVMGLELGADDYLTKPFSVAELLARLRALLRRTNWETAMRSEVQVAVESPPLTAGDLEVDFLRRRVSLAGKVKPLSVMEFDLLAFLIRHPGRPFSRAELLEAVWGHDLGVYENNVNTQINRLRRKIEKDPSNPQYIKTVWGIGYRFAEDEELK